jgi:hypothetical protein
MVSALPTRGLLIHKPKVCFMDKSRGLQGMASSLAAQMAGGKLAEFAIDERRKLVEGLLVAPSPCSQEFCDFAGRRHAGSS